MPSYYELDSSRVSFREYFWETKNPLVLLIAFILKLLRIRVPSSSEDPNVDSTLQCLVPELPLETTTRFSPIAAELLNLGFTDPVYHQFDDHATQTRVCWATFRHGSGRQFARIHHRFWGKVQKKDRGMAVQFITALSDGSFVVSSNGKPDLLSPPAVRVDRLLKATPSDLLARHERTVTAALARQSITHVASQAEMIAAVEALHVLHRDFNLSRGVFRERNQAEKEKADACLARVEQARADGLEHPEIMAELARLQDQKPKWSSALWVLVLSAVGFVAAGAMNWDWKITLWLIPILLLHEFGHWLAMRVFRYRNLRMFFIPFFGAAVTGQNWNVPGWKKALVYLAGPLPGIFIGIVLGITGMVIGNQFLKQAALMLILINGFNLLPVLPLDGGHVLHATLFCRNRWLDIGFRTLAVIALLCSAAFGLGKLLMGVGIMLAIGLPIAFKMGKIADRFRHQPLPAPLPGEDRIPPATAQALISAIKSEMPAGGSNAIIAQHTLNIFETLNAKPPNALVTIALLLLYGGSVFASVIGAAFIFISKEGDLGRFFTDSIHQPQFSVACGEVETWQGATAPTSAPVNLLVASYREATNAREEFGEMKSSLPGNAAVTWFGSSLIVALPAEDDAGREQWFDDLQTGCTNIFVVVSNDAVSLSLQFLAPDAATATNLALDLNDYFGSPNSERLIPPWDPRAVEPQFTAYRQARRVWRELQDEVGQVWEESDIMAYSKKITAANRRGAARESRELEEEQLRRTKELQSMVRADFQSKYAGTPYEALVLLHGRWAELNPTNRVERDKFVEELSGHLGSLEDADSMSPLSFGYVAQNGLLMTGRYMSIGRPARNLPALLRWLCQNDCIDVKYEVHGGGYDLDGIDLDETVE